MIRVVPLLAFAWVSLLSGAGAPVSHAGTAAVHVDVNAPPARQISAYNFFADIRRHLPNDGVVPYTVNSPLFSDYAEKHRFVYLPPGEAAAYAPGDDITFPVGTVLIKTFSYPLDRRQPEQRERILETRLLMHRPEGWAGYPYVWNDDLSDARLAVAGARVDVAWVHGDGSSRETRYKIPNMNECKQCHENNEKMGPIGPKLRQLNGAYDYPGGTENQLAYWVRAGILAGLHEQPRSLPRLPDWDDARTGALDARARAYLEVNCAHCHNPGGEAASTGLDLSWDQHEPVAYGVNKLPTAAGPASRGYTYAIRPGQPNRSFLLTRLRETDPAKMMPRTGRTLPHEEGIALLEAWIAGMAPDLGSETQFGTTQ